MDFLDPPLSFRRPSLLGHRNRCAYQAQPVLVEAHLTLEFLHHGGLGRNLEDRVRAFPLLLDVVREPALSPVIDFGDLGAERRELRAELLQHRGHFLIGRTRIDDHEDFVRSQFSLTSPQTRVERKPYQTSKHRSEEHTSELQSRLHLVCRLLLEKKKKKHTATLIVK